MVQRRLFFGLLAFGLWSASVFAENEQRPNLELALSVQKKVNVMGEDGKPKVEWQNVQGAGPNDTLRYTIRFENKGSSEARLVTIVDPIPPGTTYLKDSAEGESTSVAFSLDGKSFYPPDKLKYKVIQPDGSEVEHVATPDMYTHIQWILANPVPPGGKGNLSFQVLVK